MKPGDVIRAGRKKRGFSLRAFANRMKISAAYLSDIELGRRTPDGVIHAILWELRLDYETLACPHCNGMGKVFGPKPGGRHIVLKPPLPLRGC